MTTLSSTVFQASSPPISHHKLYNSPPSIRCCCNDNDTVNNGGIHNDKPNDSNGVASFPKENNILLNTAATVIRPPRPRRIILVRHGQSEGNVDEGTYTRVADPAIALTKKGMTEGEERGKIIADMIQKDGADDWKVYFYVSPYRRARETLRCVAKAFGRSRIVGLREEPRLREQDFGNFQDREQMKIQKAVRHRYGRFFYQFPNGESAADVYDGITGFRETLKSDIDVGRFQPPGEQSPNMNLVIVSHGLTLRVFLMRWYKWTVKQFEGLNNMDNGSMMILKCTKVVILQCLISNRYSLLMHHTKEEPREFGLTEEMLTDQEWQKIAKPGELNYDCSMTGPSFFTHFEEEGTKTSAPWDNLSNIANFGYGSVSVFVCVYICMYSVLPFHSFLFRMLRMTRPGITLERSQMRVYLRT